MRELCVDRLDDPLLVEVDAGSLYFVHPSPLFFFMLRRARSDLRHWQIADGSMVA